MAHAGWDDLIQRRRSRWSEGKRRIPARALLDPLASRLHRVSLPRLYPKAEELSGHLNPLNIGTSATTLVESPKPPKNAIRGIRLGEPASSKPRASAMA